MTAYGVSFNSRTKAYEVIVNGRLRVAFTSNEDALAWIDGDRLMEQAKDQEHDRD